MRLFGTLIRCILWLMAGLLLLAVVWGFWSGWAYRDIPLSELEKRYGSDNLHSTNLNGQPLFYRIDGKDIGTAPAVLLIHSHYFDSGMYDQWAKVLGQEYTVLRFDMTSHGFTGPDINNDYSMARTLDILDGLLDELTISKLAIVGSSLGGNVAFHWAARHPERATHLVLVNSGGLKRQQSSRRSAAGIAPWFYRVFYFIPELAYRQFLLWMVADKEVVDDALVERFHAMFRREDNRFAEMERMRQFDVGSPEETLARVKVPTLIMWGEENPQLPVTQIEQFIQLLGNAASVRSIRYPGLGHVLPLESPRQAAEDIRQFLKE